MAGLTSPSLPTTDVASPPASSRSSLSTDRPVAATRRNKSALRDYYKLADATATGKRETVPQAPTSPEDGIATSELDRADFEAEQYVKNLLNSKSTNEILRVEGQLLSDIRSLDGERKALVYDNYSKLIAATDTIKRMRSNMDPLAPTTETLKPAIGRIESMSADLSSDLKATISPAPGVASNERGVKMGSPRPSSAERQLVRWVLDGPRRLELLLKTGKRDEAEQQWQNIQRLLEQWKGVAGVEELQERCRVIFHPDGT